MKALPTTLLIFAWSIPCFLFLSLLSLFYTDEFLGVWILSPIDYPFSYSVVLWIAFSCSAIAVSTFRNRITKIALFPVLLGVFLGFIANILISLSNFYELYYFVIFMTFLLGTHNIFALLLFLFGFFSLFFLVWINLFNVARTKIHNHKDKLLSMIGVSILPLIPMSFPFFLCILLTCKFPQNSESISKSRKTYYMTPILILFILSFVWILTTDGLPGLIIPPIIRDTWGKIAFDRPHHYSMYYQELSQKLLDCELIREQLGKIKTTALVEGKNYELWDIAGGADAVHLNIELVGEKDRAIVRGCLPADSRWSCAPHEYGLKSEDENVMKVYSKTGYKKLYISECLQ